MTSPTEGDIQVAKPDPALIQEIFDKDPLDLTTEELDLVIANFRAERAEYRQEAPKKVSGKRAKAATKQPELPLSPDISLEDLGLDL
jgi:hypothetical protein